MVKDGTFARMVLALQIRLERTGKLDLNTLQIDHTLVRSHKSATGAKITDQALGRSRGGISCKIHLLADGKGVLRAVVQTAEQGGDATQATLLIPKHEDMKIKTIGRRMPYKVVADRAYDSQEIRGFLRLRAITAVIPERKLRKGTKHRRKGRKPKLTVEIYSQRNRI